MTTDPKNDPKTDPKTDPETDPKAGGDEGDKIDPQIAEIMKDPKAVETLLKSKREANAEAKDYRLKLEKLEEAQTEAEKEKLKEQEKYKELYEKNESETKAKTAKFETAAKRAALKVEAVKQGIIDTDAINLIDLTDVKIDAEYEVTNAEEVIKAFKEKKPHFFKAGDGDGDDETEITPGPEGDKKPGLRNKVKGSHEELTPDQRIDSYYAGKGKK